MEKKDIIYLVIAITAIAVVAIVVKPLFASGLQPSLVQSGISEQEVIDAPEPITVSVTSIPRVGAWDGEVKILHLIGEPVENMSTAESTPNARVYVGESTVTAAYPVVPEHKPVIPEGATHMPPIDSRGDMNTTAIFKQTYDLRYTSVAFQVDVVKPPFVIEFTTVPTTSDPYYLNNPHFCFMTITVRDSKTMEIVTEEGYGRTYGTEPEKDITLFRSGSFHVTLYGNMVQSKVVVKAGQ